MSFTVKAYLEADGRVQEVRRFGLDLGVSSNHGYLVQKLSQIFPSLQGKSFTTFWKDPEGDRVSFSSDEELMEALSYKDDIFKVYLAVDGSPAARDAADSSCASGEGQLHRGVVCDGCNGPIRGMRFKCTVCPDFDLCSGCERKCLHTEHDMLRISKPRSHCMRPEGGCGWRGPNPCQPGGGGWRGSNPCHPGRGGWRGSRHPRREGGCTWPESNGWHQWCHGAQGGPSDASTQNDFLRHMGEQVSAWLEPFGIDVCVQPKPCSSSCNSKSEQQQQHVPEATTACSSGGQPCPGRAAASGDGPHTPAEAQQPPTGGVQRQQQQQQQDSLLEAKVASAVEAMRAMGFHDDDGWLSAELRSNGVDIQKAVGEVLKKNASRYP